MICSPPAPLEMVWMKPLLPRPKKKPLIGQTHADRANVGKIDEPNAKIVALRDDGSDSAKGTESQINDVAKIECVNECEHPPAVLVLYLQCTSSTLLFL